MTVVDESGGAGTMFSVSSESGREYMVDPEAPACECDDFRYNVDHEAGELCKHILRVEVAALHTRAIPPGISWDDVDPLLGTAVPGSPVADETDDQDERPDECECWDPDAEMCCFNCWMSGFADPNPDADDAGDE